MKLVFVLLAFAIALADSAKILAVFPVPAKSHYAIGEATMRALNEAGHEVTMISAFEPKKPMKNYRQITIENLIEAMAEENSFNGFEIAEMSPFASIFFLYMWGKLNVNNVMNNKEVQALLNSNEKFDAVVVELFAIDALLGLGQHFGCPVVAVNTFDGVYWNDIYTGNESPYSYVPMAHLTNADRMNYWERLYNTVYSVIEKVSFNFYHLPIQKGLYQKYFPKATQTFEETHKSISILFMNNHVSSASARPFLPNMIGINGIHVEPAQPLPADIKNFLDSATDGVILFSMGSMVQSTDWSPAQRNAMVKTFAKLKQRVIWKYENETLPGKPDNVMISSWLPQRDIVAHPNVKLFITHGGNLGTTEALSEGVPLLGIPLFGDQTMNLRRAVDKGYALTMDFHTINEQNFEATVTELLNNPKYYENAQRLSAAFNDRPLTPKETVVYWTEFAIRQKGAHFLKSAGQNLSYIEYNLIDVYLTLAVITAILFYIFYKIFKCLLRKIFRRSPSKKQKKN